MALNYMLALRVAQAFFAILVLALTAYVISWYNDGTTSAPSQINFLLFCGIWTFVLAVPYLALSPRMFPAAAHKFAILAVEALTTLFWFAGFIAAAVFVSDLSFCKGNVCRAAEAAIVFGAFEWLLFAGTTSMATIHVFRTRGSTTRPDPKMEVRPTVTV